MQNILEEEIKNRVAANFFKQFDCTKILGKIDFAVKIKRENNAVEFDDEYLLWAEAKQKPTDILISLSQLVLTIGKARTFDEIMPPKFLGAFDNEKIAFIPYHEVQDIFYQNDFNWNVAPSNHETKEFKQILSTIETALNRVPWQTYIFNFDKDEKELRKFIKENFIVGKDDITKIKIDKNNFKIVFNKWTESVMPSISVNWDNVKKSGLLAGDFYLADLLSENNKTLKEKLFVLLQNDYYEIDRHLNELEIFTSSRVEFKDNQKAHNEFWNKYERPPHEDYWDYIINRRDLLVPPDVRERKGSFFTPKIWVELSQKYLADVFGENWQEEYYIWDCCAGTGNLLEGLTNKYKIFASTLDKQDVFVMLDRIKNGANLLESHVFQFDFLNDDFDKLPENLQKIINDEEKQKKLVIYINPPYAESGIYGTRSKAGVATTHKTYQAYKEKFGLAANELYIQFFARIYEKMPNSSLATFGTLKYVCAPNFKSFRNFFKAKFEKGFVIKANSFDNVKGNFPIAFAIWNLQNKTEIKQIKTDVFLNNDQVNECWQDGEKNFYSYSNNKFINDWIKTYKTKENGLGKLIFNVNDFQTQNGVWISYVIPKGHFTVLNIRQTNLIHTCVYFAVRHCIEATWLNDRDQFLFPNKKWEKDIEFQNNCLAFTIFYGQNKVSSKDSLNHWIPFSEKEVNAKEKFDSNYMLDFINGKIDRKNADNLFEKNKQEYKKMIFSTEAQSVFDAGLELWKYYHKQKNVNVNASLYDIREYFKDRNDKGKMNSKSENETYNTLIGTLRENLKILAQKIEPKVYEYEFLLK